MYRECAGDQASSPHFNATWPAHSRYNAYDFRPTIRVAALQKRWDRLRAGLDLILQQRGADMADLPGGAGGLPVRYKGKEADRLVVRIDPGVVSLVAVLAERRRGRTSSPRRGLGVPWSHLRGSAVNTAKWRNLIRHAPRFGNAAKWSASNDKE